MKRILVICFCIVIMTSLGACKSSAVKAVEQAITSIGIVTIDSENAIEAAENAYSELSDKEKAKVSNYSNLIAARSSYNAIPEPTLTKEEMLIIATTLNADTLLNEIGGNRAKAPSYVGNTYCITGHVSDIESDYCIVLAADTGDWNDHIHCDGWYAYAYNALFRVYLPTEELVKLSLCENIQFVGKLTNTETFTYYDMESLALDITNAYLVKENVEYQGRYR